MPRLLHAFLGLGLLLTVGCGTVRPSAQPRSGATSEPAPHFDLPDLERRVLRELNEVRQDRQRERLRPDSALAAIARAHSEAMRTRGFFAHMDPDGHRGGDRAQAANYPFRAFGENLYRGRLADTVTEIRQGGRSTFSTLWHTPDTLARLIVQSWMESPGHRDNMLSTVFDNGGVGIAVGPDDEVLVTLNLSAR